DDFVHLYQRLSDGLHSAPGTGPGGDAETVLQRNILDHRADAGRVALEGLGALALSHRDGLCPGSGRGLLGDADGQRQDHHPRAGAGAEPAGFSWPLLRPAAAGGGLALRRAPVGGLVGLYRLPADLLHRGGPWRPDRELRLLGVERASVPVAADAAVD